MLCNDGEHWSHCSKIQGIFIYMDNWYVHPLVTVVVTQKLHITYCRGGSDYGLIDNTAVSGKNYVAGDGDTFAYCAKMASGTRQLIIVDWVMF